MGSRIHTGREKTRFGRLAPLLVLLALIAAACSSTAAETDTTAAETESEDTSEAVEVEDAPAEETVAVDDAMEDEAVDESTDEASAPDPVELTNQGTSVEVTFEIPTERFDGVGFSAIGREGDLNPATSSLIVMRATGFVSLDERSVEAPATPFTETLETWLTHPELNVASQSETTVGGFDATVVDFTLDRSDDSRQECGEPPQDQCIWLVTTPDPEGATTIVVRTSLTLRMWAVDQGENDPLIFLLGATEGDDEFFAIGERAMETVVLGDPQPSPS